MPIPTRDKPYSYDVSLDVREAEVDSYQRCIRGCVASDESLDSHGTVLLASGWDLSRYAKNPVLKWGHHSFGNPAQPEDIMGTAPSRIDGSRLVTDLQFSPKGLNPKADMVFDQVSSGIVKGLSVEFKPLEYHIEKDEKGDETVIVDRAMLAAISIVPVPSNPNALTRAMLEGDEEQDDVRKTPSKALVVEPDDTRATHDAGANEGTARPAKERNMSDQDTTVGLPASIAALLGVDNEEAARGAISTLMLKIDNAEKRAIESETRAVKAESDLKARVDAEVTAEVDGLIKSKRIDESKREAALTLARVNIGAFREMYPAQAPAAAEGPKTEVLERHIS
ncbi:MAG: HK97 family phage prohead protease, partial [Candidatus Cryosericum sp.]